jgi:hypothetical protein
MFCCLFKRIQNIQKFVTKKGWKEGRRATRRVCYGKIERK